MEKNVYILYWNITKDNSLDLADTSEMFVSWLLK